jgi:hypothetical protein
MAGKAIRNGRKARKFTEAGVAALRQRKPHLMADR